MNCKNIRVAAIISVLVSGCVVYHPQTADVPLISKKNDLRVDAGVALVPSAYATVSYGLTNKIAIQGYGNIGSDYKYYLQAATGLYKNRGRGRIVECYGGYGYGYGDAYNDSNFGNLYGNYQLYFGQINCGVIANEFTNFEAGIGIKAGYLHTNLTDRNYYKWVSATGPYITYHDESLLIEPLVFIRAGGEKWRFSLKLTGNVIRKYTNIDRAFPYRYANLGIGINYRLFSGK